MNTSRDWGNLVRDRRSDLGMTQGELAERVGRARQWVVRFESGHAGSANIDSLIKLIDVLDLNVNVDSADEDPDPMFMDVDFTDSDDR